MRRRFDPRVTGPHAALDGPDGEERLIWRCENCGAESPEPVLRGGCWVCDDGVLWR